MSAYDDGECTIDVRCRNDDDDDDPNASPPFALLDRAIGGCAATELEEELGINTTLRGLLLVAVPPPEIEEELKEVLRGDEDEVGSLPVLDVFRSLELVCCCCCC